MIARIPVRWKYHRRSFTERYLECRYMGHRRFGCYRRCPQGARSGRNASVPYYVLTNPLPSLPLRWRWLGPNLPNNEREHSQVMISFRLKWRASQVKRSETTGRSYSGCEGNGGVQERNGKRGVTTTVGGCTRIGAEERVG